jgi:tRNA(fMet)-specific endonuclease VapC
MRYLVLDTCAIIHIIRGKASGQQIQTWINSLSPQPRQIISTVTKAELLTFALMAGWQTNKIDFLHKFLTGVTYVDINHADNQLIDNYKLIDGYSKNKAVDPNGNYKGGSHILMGKNDIWIAATARTLNATLLTSDGDFDHLDPHIINIKKI